MANQPTTQEIKDYIVERAKARNVDPNQALALAQVESSFNPTAVSKTGAAGIYQLFPAASSDSGHDYDKVKSDWRTNVDAGITYYKQKLDQAGGDVPTALGYYNQGKGGFDKQLKTGNLAPEVKKYISHPAFAPYVNDSLNQAGNPIKPLLAKQENANKFDRSALMQQNIANQPTQAEVMQTQANPNEPVAQESDLANQIRQQRLENQKMLQSEDERRKQLLNQERENRKGEAITDAANFMVSAFFGQKGKPDVVVSGEDAGRGRAGAQMGLQSQTVLGNMRQQFNPNAFRSQRG